MKHINKSNASMGVAASALFIALGGPAQAATLITGSNIKDSSITGKDIKNKSLTAADFKGSIRGKTGKTGAAGKNGTNGSVGPAGPAGTPGAAGAAGVAGAKGATGPTGDRGPAGAQGPAGPIGPQGIQGPKGDTGATGPSGPAGAKGDSGPTGPSGPDGARWVLVDNNGAIVKASDSGFRVANAYPNNSAGTGNVYIDSGDTDLTDNGIVASIALANQYSQKGSGETGTLNNGRNPGSNNNPEFSGEITATKCAIPGVVACAPTDLLTNGGTGVSTDTNRYFVVSPRNSDGSYTGTTGATGVQGTTGPTLTTNTHKRFYVIITGPRTAPVVALPRASRR